MKIIGITQRVEVIESYRERRDCLDQRWSVFFKKLDCIVVPLPNIAEREVEALVSHLSLDAIVLSGGNSLVACDPNAADIALERDGFENALIDVAVAQQIPVLGVCRGMQMLNIKYGGTLSKVKGHIATRHAVDILSTPFTGFFNADVNSYHAWGIKRENLAEPFDAAALDSDGNVEAFIHKTEKITGMMWHPEREIPFCDRDIELIKRVLL